MIEVLAGLGVIISVCMPGLPVCRLGMRCLFIGAECCLGVLRPRVRMPCCRWVVIDVRRDSANAPRRSKKEFVTLRLSVSVAMSSIWQDDEGGYRRGLEEGHGASKAFGSVSCAAVNVVHLEPVGL